MMAEKLEGFGGEIYFFNPFSPKNTIKSYINHLSTPKPLKKIN
jgi:hypothetical protein